MPITTASRTALKDLITLLTEVDERWSSEEWMTVGFNAKKAGWKKAAAPFGQKDNVKQPLMPNCKNLGCGCGAVPTTMSG